MEEGIQERYSEARIKSFNYLGPIILVDGSALFPKEEVSSASFPFIEVTEMENRYFDLMQLEAQRNETDYRGRLAFEDIEGIRQFSTGSDLRGNSYVLSDGYKQILSDKIADLESRLGVGSSSYNPNAKVGERFNEGEDIDYLIEKYEISEADIREYMEFGVDAPPSFTPFFRLSSFGATDVFIDKRDMDVRQNKELNDMRYSKYIAMPEEDVGEERQSKPANPFMNR